MTSPSRFRRIARDLERLPVELHGPILEDLEFHQLIRLSSHAGPGLTSSLTHSLAPWAHLFHHKNSNHEKDIAEFQTLLSITDKIRRFCFKQPKTRDDVPFVFVNGDLAFLQFKGKQWTKQHNGGIYISRQVMGNAKALARHWLSELNDIVIDTTWSALHEEYDTLVKPYVDSVPGAREAFSKVPFIAVKSSDCRPGGKPRYKYFINTKTAFSTSELAKVVDCYHQVRIKRAEAFAAELEKLALIYESHPTLFKMPFDLRLHAPEDLNTQHIPLTMRRQAAKLIRMAECGPWRKTDMFKHRFVWPALVPYDWSTQLFNTVVVEKAGFLDQDVTTITKASSSSTEHQRTITKLIQQCRSVVATPPAWATGGTKKDGNGVEGLSSKMKSQRLGEQKSAHTTITPLRIHVDKNDVGWTVLGTMRVFPRGEAELEWLQTFGDITATLEQGYPNLLEEGVLDVST